ncbi:hypothetical protein HC256_007332 [Beauveria bassiana]|nr:hypothetical protein HC256_007332 [Beauveria bassiana]
MAAIARDSSKILGLVIGDCAIEPPGLYMPPRRSTAVLGEYALRSTCLRTRRRGAPHRYGFYLYEQPPGFDATRWMAPASGRQGEMGNWKRIRYGLDGWASKAGLGAIVAANYFTSN